MTFTEEEKIILRLLAANPAARGMIYNQATTISLAQNCEFSAAVVFALKNYCAAERIIREAAK